jgi:hypothetical protein
LNGGEKILLVEDDEQVRRYAVAALAQHGYEVIEAEDGSEALEILGEESDVALIITDVVMPDLGGDELATEAGHTRPDLPILYVSGYDGTVLARAGLDPDAAHFLQKPFGPDDLANSVREILDETAGG